MDISFKCPWRLRVHPGQRLNLTLFDFSVFSSVTQISASQSSMCKRYASILEPLQRREQPICGGNERIRSVYISQGNQVDLRLSDFSRISRDQPDPVHFLIRFHAIGCQHVTSPRNTHVVYSDDSKHMTITCNTTREKWYLTCRDNQWVGSIANCSHGKCVVWC